MQSELDFRWLPAFFVTLWLAVCATFAFLSGWRSLATRFLAKERPNGERFRIVSGTIGHRFVPVNYHNCLSVVVTPNGLHLSILWPFRFMSPPLFIRLSDIESVEQKRFLWTTYNVIVVKRQWVRISLWGKSGVAVRKAFTAATSVSADANSVVHDRRATR
jgi:hypothetical protein